MNSQIRELVKNENAVLVFDVDGVLAAYEYGERNHNACKDNEWDEYLKTNNTYESARPLITIQKWLVEHGNIDRTYVCTASANESEFMKKADFVVRNYPIKRENIFMTLERNEKLEVLKRIHETCYPGLGDEMIIMIDDTTEVLTNIQEHSEYSTAHISSFID